MCSLFHRNKEAVVDNGRRFVAGSGGVGELHSAKDSRRAQTLRVFTPQEPLIRRRRIAVWTLGLSLAIGVRWFSANLDPKYPVGEGVYSAQVSPKWGEMQQPNAAVFYMAAVDALPANTSDATILTDSVADQKPIVQKAQPALALLRQGMQYPYLPNLQTNYFRSGTTETGLTRPVSKFEAQRAIARFLVAEANVKASTGDTAGALNASLDAIRFGIDVGQGHTHMEGIVGVLVQKTGNIRAIQYVEGLSATEARTAIFRLEEMISRERTFAQILTAERDWGYEVARDVFRTGNIETVAEFGSTSTMDACRSFCAKIIYRAGIFCFTKKGLVNSYASQMDNLIARGKIPYQTAKQLPPIPESSNPWVRHWTSDSSHFQRLLPHITSSSACNRVLLTRLAVEAYQQEHNGSLPNSLDELIQGDNPYLRTVPDDPFSRNGHAALRWNRQTETVYSVGENGLDEKGKGDDW